MAQITIRLATAEDAGTVAKIYQDYVESTPTSLDLNPPTTGEMECRICTCGQFYPFLVCEVDGTVEAYAYAFRRFEEQAFDWGAFVSTYVSQAATGHGIGRTLLGVLENILRDMGIVSIYSMATLSEKSKYFHLARGFSEAGRLREATYRQGKWRDLAYYEKTIALHDENPAPVKSVQELDQVVLENILRRAEKAVHL
ncbi:MAG: N-acetyltransferase family protein [Oscillospiraceae bacterium]|nr:N-acetyltransferase family protein [Oscillospiraceae bacterium]